MNGPIEVIKVGGSLLAWEPFPIAFRQWFEATASEASSLRLVIPGGGMLVEQIRDLDRRFGLNAETAHWGAVAVMDLHADFCGEWLGGVVVEATELDLDLHRGGPVTSFQRLRSSRPLPSGRITTTAPLPQRPIIVRMSQWLREHQQQLPLPRTWATTSDAIAAAFAEAVQATRLTLLKSCPNDDPRNYAAWTSAGLVDEVFPGIASRLPEVRWICLKNAGSFSRTKRAPQPDEGGGAPC